MTLDSEQDLIALQRIGRIVTETLQTMKAALRPGISTGELDAIGLRVLKKYGAQSAPQLVYNFPGATCISVNNEAAHGIPGERRIQPGDLVNIDVSAEFNGFFADTGASVAVPPVPPLQARLCSCAQAALERAIASVRAGVRMNQIGRAVEQEARRCGFTILRELSGHGVGRSIHEDPRHIPNYYDRYEDRRLKEGMVITIEPFLSNGATRVVTAQDGWTLKTLDGSLSAQYEHTLVVTRGHPLIITTLS